jgi:Pyridoxamine 5'-phosphate oxidase
MFGGHLEPTLLPWAWAREQLETGRNYWIATTRPGGRPHTRPVWGVWLDDAFYFSTGSLAAANLESSDEITVHLESGNEVVIVEGTAALVTDTTLARRLCDAYNPKYRWDLDPNALPGPFYEVRPRVVFGWVSDDSGLDGGAAFQGSATRWRFT